MKTNIVPFQSVPTSVTTRQRQVTDMVPVAHDFSGAVVYMAPDKPRVEPGVPAMMTNLQFHQGDGNNSQQWLAARQQRGADMLAQQASEKYDGRQTSSPVLLDIVV